tara:strand:- start:5278 stop:7134 length:1857 start_codon:yes stop_codon:yes gene_type:complete
MLTTMMKDATLEKARDDKSMITGPDSECVNDKVAPGSKGKKWTDEEETNLLNSLARGISIWNIANDHDRTCGGITSRIRKIACDLMDAGRDITEVIEKTKLTRQQIEEAVKKNEFSNKKKEEQRLQREAEKKEKNLEKKKEEIMQTQIDASKLDYDVLSVEQKCALQQFEDGDNLFITGQGGTGKTLLIRHLLKSSQENFKKAKVCAMTGCAALLLQCNARTIHSWSGIKLGKEPPHIILESILDNAKKKVEWITTDILIVDEVSMMSKRIFELLDYIGKKVRKSSKPFGGLQVVFVGDFYQLPPVSNSIDDTEDDQKFCFESPSWKETFGEDQHIVLTKIFRQSDEVFCRILNNIRNAIVEPIDVETLKKHVNRKFDAERYKGVVPTKLFAVKSKVDAINKKMFDSLNEEKKTFSYDYKTDCRTYLDGSGREIPRKKLEKGIRYLTPQKSLYEIDNLINNTPCVKSLDLKKGANVMCTVNIDLENGICNGSIGKVDGFVMTSEGKLAPKVLFSNGINLVMSMHYWHSEDYPNLAVGQYPLILAWAMTIHKSQGATLSLAEVDVGGSIFEYGQTYVALSRVKSLDGLYLSNFDPKKVKTSKRVLDFYNSIPVVEYEEE